MPLLRFTVPHPVTILIGICFALLDPFSIAHAQSRTYKITYRNRTPQTLTDAVCAVHSRKVTPIQIGEVASEGLASLAEDGVSGTLAQELRQMKGVRKVVRGNFVGPGRRSSISVTVSRGRRLSCVFGMLVATNDGFPALLSRRLPTRVGRKVRFRARAYDAGSESNTESCDHVPGGPCDAHFVGIAENGTIQLHPGIQDIADLDRETHGWSEPAVRGTIVRE